jgi:hypothetical protein
MLSGVTVLPALEAPMTDRKPRRLRSRKDIGKVVFPIEKLMAGRSASMSCVHIEADLEADAGPTNLIREPSHAAVMGKDRK